MKPDKNWELPEGSLLCSECWSHRKNPEGHIKAEERAINYEGECVTVVQIPPTLTRDAWNKVDKLVQNGWTIKGVIEREYIHASLVILEKVR